MSTKIILKVNIENGVGAFDFPTILKESNFTTSMTCHFIKYENAELREGYFIVSNGSRYGGHGNPYNYNILGSFMCESLHADFWEFNGAIDAPLNTLAETVKIFVIKSNDEVSNISGVAVIELTGYMDNALLI